MASIDALINKRLGQPQPSTKMQELAKRSNEGSLTSFSGLFKVCELSNVEKNSLEKILEEYCINPEDVQKDLSVLISLTSEVKAITNQAALLHGERIKQAQEILKRYRDGAFSLWLVTSYGNRQTPYNFLLYYEFSMSLPVDLRKKIETLPRQVIYTLASRQAPLEKKQLVIAEYSGQTKSEMLDIIRREFPLESDDKRKKDVGQQLLANITRLYYSSRNECSSIEPEKKSEIIAVLNRFLTALK